MSLLEQSTSKFNYRNWGAQGHLTEAATLHASDELLL
jgi:hypothetical protein